ncbi:MAG: hypothetical protein DRQ58_01905 [Gammaproteobacteria bacterium]|nr:MAG: hypothetical protein DRQ58_01905 [Gammaproteobacteria bacterium]
MGIEGFIDIQLIMKGSGINDVEIRSSRPVYASRVFIGKSVNKSLTMLPLLFSICGVAQACAGVRACEQALGLKVPVQLEQVRNKLVNMETLREHLWRILLDWPILLDEQSLNQPLQTQEMSQIIKHQNDYRKLLTAGSNPFLLEQEIPSVCVANCQPISKLNQILEKSIFALSPDKWLKIDSIEKLQHWFESSETIAARFLKKIHQNQWQSLGRNHIKGLLLLETEGLETKSLEMEALDIDTLYAQFENETFVKQPLWEDKCCETNSLTRVDSPLLQELHRQWGNGLMSRLVARLTEMAQIICELLDEPENPSPAMNQNRCNIQGNGIGVVNAARGLLIHHVSVEQERIKKYQILAPTEWNFHPQGVVTQSLACLQGDSEQIKIQADLLINAIDPCVGYKFLLDKRE